MIKEKTLFILGAGAHVPYGFPDAKGLKKVIVRDFPSKLLHLYNISDEGFAAERAQIENEAKNFVREFKNSGIYSIDLFLSLRPEFHAIGKKAIIIAMILTEGQHRGSQVNFDKDEWFLYLYNRSLEGIYTQDHKTKYFENQFSFITFNYDRMIENYFRRRLSSTFNLTQADLTQYFDHLKIKHVYGSLAYLPEQKNDKVSVGEFSLEYGSTITLNQLDKMQDNIKIINEERKNGEDWSEIISSYDRVFFLGFGYAEENMKVLNLPECLRKGQKVYGTAFNNSENEIEKIRQKFFEKSWMKNAHEDLVIRPVDNLTLLRDYL